MESNPSIIYYYYTLEVLTKSILLKVCVYVPIF